MIYQPVSRAARASATADRRQRRSEQTTEPRQTASKDRANQKQSRPEPQAKPVESCRKASENITESKAKDSGYNAISDVLSQKGVRGKQTPSPPKKGFRDYHYAPRHADEF